MSKLDALLRDIAEEQNALRASDDTAERLAGRFRHYTPHPPSRVRLWAPLAAAVVLAAAVLLVRTLRTAPDLAVKLGDSGHAPLVGAWLGAPDSASLPLEFSDGSRFELAARARARVIGLERSNPHVELASGSLHVHVIPGGPGTWRISAGPFNVKVTGTRFVVSYEPSTDVFEVSMEEGQVELTGCVFGNGRKLAVGQRVRASCRQPRVEVSYRDGETAAIEAPLPPNAPRPAAPAIETLNPSAVRAVSPDKALAPAAGGAKPSTVSWLALARGGKYEDAYSAAEHEGFDALTQRSAAGDLMLLADVARHAHAPRKAKQALLGLRRRFTGSPDAATAAFALGRLEFDEFHAYGAAADWFRAYLKERPSGSMAREALGRLIEAYDRAGDSASAASTARRYLRDYPSGPHAALASRLVSAP
ncbi:MAG TPA: FecR domain-containing protein [Polyangiaceae bacterium]|jgi:ferric-dicitrate binding protein FerR (iron transport regulator)|nr:FecR domain-containing protein [Polyangiaceae bacterium]